MSAKSDDYNMIMMPVSDSPRSPLPLIPMFFSFHEENTKEFCGMTLREAKAQGGMIASKMLSVITYRNLEGSLYGQSAIAELILEGYKNGVSDALCSILEANTPPNIGRMLQVIS